MATATDFSSYDGLWKRVYGKEIEDALPEFSFLQKRFDFAEAEKLGLEYQIPVAISDEGGLTYVGESGDMVDLNAPITGQLKPATIKGSEIQLRGWVSNKALAASEGGKEKAFKLATSAKVFSMNKSMRKRVELMHWYGQSHIGVVASVTDLGSNNANVVITDATWAPGIWQGVKDHLLDAFHVDGTKHSNTAGLRIVSVNLDAKTLRVAYVSSVNEVQAADTLHFYGARTGLSSWKEAAGIKKILTNSSTLFGIDAATNDVWLPNQYTVGGLPSVELLQRAAVLAANRGCMEKLIAVVPTKAWAEMNIAESALVQHQKAGGKAINGFTGLDVEAANGTLEIVRSPFVMEGEAFLLPEKYLYRVGAKDVTFDLGGEKFFFHHPDKNGFEMRCMTDQAILLTRPSYGVYCSNLSYT